MKLIRVGSKKMCGFPKRPSSVSLSSAKGLAVVAVVCAFGLETTALATPVFISEAAFSSSATMVDFQAIGNQSLITNQYSGLGVTFSGNLYGMTNPGDTSLFPNNGGGHIASNWLYFQGLSGDGSFMAAFTNTAERVGFYVETNYADNTSVELFLDGISSGILTFNSGLNATFLGIEDTNGFTSIRVRPVGSDNHFVAIDNFRFEAMAEPFEAVPEPLTVICSVLATGGLGAYARRRQTA